MTYSASEDESRVPEFRIVDRFSSIRVMMTEYSDTDNLTRAILRDLERTFDLRQVQLTLYYDLPLALEVTHYRCRDGKFDKSVVLLREDEDPREAGGDDDAMTPADAAFSTPLTFRDRLVGLLLVGGKSSGGDHSPHELEALAQIAPMIGIAVDNAMMIRHVAETNQKLFETEKLASIGQLAGGLAHEIRNPLSSVKMNLQGLARAGNLDDRNRRRLQICLDEIERLNNLIGELMHLARRSRLEVGETNAARLFEKSLVLARAELEQRRVKVIMDRVPEKPVIRADESKLVRALLNLVLNAAQAIGSDGRIVLRAESYGKGVELTVEDDGPGIPPEYNKDIALPFFTTKAEGLGLGLANVLKTVQEHGGELDFSSEVGKGTVFSIRLPEAPPKHVKDPAALRVVPR